MDGWMDKQVHRNKGSKKKMNIRNRNTPKGCVPEFLGEKLQRFIAVLMQTTGKKFGSLE